MRAEPRRGLNANLDMAIDLDGMDNNTSVGFDAWRLWCKEYAPLHESTGTGHMMKALTLTQASNRDTLKEKMNQVADCTRECEEVVSKPMDEDVKRSMIVFATTVIMIMVVMI